MSGMFWGPNVWAGLRPGDAGDEEELQVQQNTSAAHPTGGLPSLLALDTGQLDSQESSKPPSTPRTSPEPRRQKELVASDLNQVDPSQAATPSRRSRTSG